ncbi:hypothetical protein BBJ28_00013736 [Nothophytophthora sp. Chile5]|nr:hypothetical protein BBJ28_00013736 [Nothophytophthora sp. Chile5]
MFKLSAFAFAATVSLSTLGTDADEKCALVDFTAQASEFLLLNNAVDVVAQSSLLPTLIKGYEPLVLQDIALGEFSYSILGQDLTFTPTLDLLNVTGIAGIKPEHLNVSSSNCVDLGAYSNGQLAIDATLSLTLDEIDTSITVDVALTLEKPTLACNVQASMYGCAKGAAGCEDFSVTNIEVAGVDGEYSSIMDSLLLRFKDAAVQTLALDFASISNFEFSFHSSGAVISAITDALAGFSADEINKKGDAYDAFTSRDGDEQEALEMSVIETGNVDVQVNATGATSQVNGYRIMGLLGEGAFSKVYHCVNSDGSEFALKILNKSFLKRKREYKRVDGKLMLSNAFQKVQKEVAIMKKLSHSNLVKLHEVIDSLEDDKLFLVLELIRGGQIMHWDDKKFRYVAHGSITGVLDKAAVRNCLRDVVDALDYLHHNQICHRDIKPENILLSSAGGHYKLADFGVAHMREGESTTAAPSSPIDTAVRLRSTEGTYHFLAPECTTGEEYDPYQVDVWALGVTMHALLLGTLPFGSNVASLSAVMDSIREDPLVLPPELDAECAELLSRLMEKDPNSRISVTQLKTHPWLLRASDEAAGTATVAPRRVVPVVQVTQQEIETAFTPVNNFILMTKIKMKMSSRLSRARRSLSGGDGDTQHLEKLPVTTHARIPVPVSQALSANGDDLIIGKEDTDPKVDEVATSEVSPTIMNRVQRRPSRMMETLNETMGTITTTLTRRKSQVGVASPAFDSFCSSDGKTTTTLATPADDSAVTVVAKPGGASPTKPGAASRLRFPAQKQSTQESCAVGALVSTSEVPASVSARGGEGGEGKEPKIKLSCSPEKTGSASPSKQSTISALQVVTKGDTSVPSSPTTHYQQLLTREGGGSPSSSSLESQSNSPTAIKGKVKAGREAKLPPLELSFSPLSSPAMSPISSPRVRGDVSLQEAFADSMPKNAAESPSKSPGLGRNLGVIKVSPSPPRRATSSKITGLSCGASMDDDHLALSSDGADMVSRHQVGSSTQIVSVGRSLPPSMELLTPTPGSPHRLALSLTKSLALLPKQQDHPGSPSTTPRPVLHRTRSVESECEGSSLNAPFVRTTSLAKVLDQCLTSDQKANIKSFKVEEQLETAHERRSSLTSVQPAVPAAHERRASVGNEKATATATATASANNTATTEQALVLKSHSDAHDNHRMRSTRDEKTNQTAASTGRGLHHHGEPPVDSEAARTAVSSSSSRLDSNHPPPVLQSESSKRRSILETQDSLRLILRRNTSMKLKMFEGTGASYTPNDGTSNKPKTSVCTAM